MRRATVGTALAALGLSTLPVLGALGAAPTTAAEIPTTVAVASLVSEAYVVNRTYRDAEVWVATEDRVRLSATRLTDEGVEALLVEVRSDDAWAELQLVAPDGETLGEGSYAAQAVGDRDPGRAGFALRSGGRGTCSDVQADVTVHRWSDDLSAVQMTFTERCAGPGGVALGERFGEVRTDAPVTDGLLVAPTRVEWPTHDVGLRGTTVPVTVRNLGSEPREVPVGASGDAGVLVDGSCDTLAPGDLCWFGVTDRPEEAGTTRARLELGEGRPGVALGVTGAPGVTAMALGTGAFARGFLPADSSLAALGDAREVSFTATLTDRADPDPFQERRENGSVVVSDPAGLQVGRLYRSDGSTQAYSLEGSAACAPREPYLFRLSDLQLDGAGRMTSYAMRWVCFESAGRASTGSVAWRSDAARPPAPEPPPGPPSSPLDVDLVVLTSNAVELGWRPVERADSTGSEVYVVRGDGDPADPTKGRRVYSGPADTASFGGLRPGRDYTITVVQRFGGNGSIVSRPFRLHAYRVRAAVLRREPAPGLVRVLARVVRSASGEGRDGAVRATVGAGPDAEERIVDLGRRGIGILDVPRGETVRLWTSSGDRGTGLNPRVRPTSTAPFVAEPGVTG